MKPLKASKGKRPVRISGDTRSVALWGGGAMLFAVVGAASVFLAQESPFDGRHAGATLLPPPGEVGRTASITPRKPGEIEVYPSDGGVESAQARRLMQAELETLRREVAALRRAMSIMHERGEILAERREDAETNTSSRNFRQDMDAAVDARAGAATPVETVPAPNARLAEPRPSAPIADDLPAKEGAESKNLIEAVLPETLREPVRIVALPVPGEAVTTASIPAPEEQAPAAEEPGLSVRNAAGHIASDSGDRIQRTDFGIDLGLHASQSAAEEAWTGLRAARKDLPAQLVSRIVPEEDGKGVRLYVGPYPNAADAAATCVHIADEGISCRPVPFPQDRAEQR
ncbi:SPOR domain-containing protein [Stappia sp. 28M-7]|uniref:SPOR domain-containing protein n=1 Tax=Stappia sp. 28M-7 TaxID=2762596 RepID=UPI00163C8756|nr:SPOR domain-containing protein [Stappia sp. 28M-7]